MPVMQQACAAGVKAAQLREKDWSARQVFETAAELKKICEPTQTQLFINDRADIADAVGAEGVQLTAGSLAPPIVRKILSTPKLIGVSTHSLSEAVLAEAADADFIVFGPVFETQSKRTYGPPQGLKRLQQVVESVRIPVFAVGGIDPPRARVCLDHGAWGVAVISAIMSADNVKEKMLEFEKALGSL